MCCFFFIDPVAQLLDETFHSVTPRHQLKPQHIHHQPSFVSRFCLVGDDKRKKARKKNHDLLIFTSRGDNTLFTADTDPLHPPTRHRRPSHPAPPGPAAAGTKPTPSPSSPLSSPPRESAAMPSGATQHQQPQQQQPGLPPPDIRPQRFTQEEEEEEEDAMRF